MSFHFSSWSIKNPVPIIVTFLIFSIVGIASFLSLGINDTPNIDIPTVLITVNQRGASPTELESQVTKKIEDAVASLDNLDKIVSTVSDGTSSTFLEFILGTDTNQATNEVRNALAQIRQDLPQDINEPIVQKLNFAGGSIMTYAIGSKQRSVEELSNLVDRTIIPELLNVEGVGKIERLGGLDREIRIDLNPNRLQAYEITATEINQQIRQFNINLPGGRSEIGGSEQNVRTLGSAKNVRELRNYPIILNNGDTVALSNLGTVEDGFAESRQTAYLNGQPVIAFSVQRSSGSSLVQVEERVRQEVEQLRTTLPPDIQFQLVFTRAEAIRKAYQATIDALVLGCILTVVTVGIFLRDWRVTLITGMALPLSIIPTFWVMKSLNYTLNEMTLLALALAVGNLVDDAICMIENIDRHLQMGKKPFTAAIDGAREIGLAVIATTATIVAVFIPVAFMGGIPGQFFLPFGMTVSVSTMFSTLVAVTVTPMLSAYLLKSKPIAVSSLQSPSSSIKAIAVNRSNSVSLSALKNLPFPHQKPPQSPQNSSLRLQPYRLVLNWALGNRVTTLILAVAFFFGSLQLIPYIPKGLFDSGDTGLSIIQVELPPGSKLNDTVKITRKIDRLIESHPAVDSVLATVGGDSKVNSAEIFIDLLPKQERELTQLQFQEQMRKPFAQIPGARISFLSQSASGSNKDVSLIFKSNNPELLTRIAKDLETQMGKIPSLVDVASNLSRVKPEIIIRPNPQRASELGVSVQSIASTASLALIGDNDSNLAKFNLSDRQIPIRVQLQPDKRNDIETLKNLRIPSKNGNLIALNNVADIRLGSGPAEIKRFNRSRQMTIEANLQGIALGDALTQIRALPAINPLPPEVKEQPAGDAKIMRDIFSRFLGALGLAILCIYAILVLLYNNFLYPFAILVALPLSVGGTLLGLLIMQKELGLFALIGIVLLMGLVTKNAILLVDFALVGLQQGKSQFKAVVEAGTSRLRPILMTSVSTVAGMLPIALELGADGEVRSPMAISVIGGFTTSTLLTLIVVPVLFTYVDNFLASFFGKKGRI